MYMTFGVVLLVNQPEGGGRINCNTTTKGEIKCLFPLIGCFPARARSFTCVLPNKVMRVNLLLSMIRNG